MVLQLNTGLVNCNLCSEYQHVCLIRVHPGGEGRNRPSAPDPSSAGAAWADPATAPDPTGHHTGDHQQVCTNSHVLCSKEVQADNGTFNPHGGQKAKIKLFRQEQSLSIKN